jgi:hypothetical protein
VTFYTRSVSGPNDNRCVIIIIIIIITTTVRDRKREARVDA